MNRMTHRCKNITLPQTSFAGGNNIEISPMFIVVFIQERCPRGPGVVKAVLVVMVNVTAVFLLTFSINKAIKVRKGLFTLERKRKRKRHCFYMASRESNLKFSLSNEKDHRKKLIALLM